MGRNPSAAQDGFCFLDGEEINLGDGSGGNGIEAATSGWNLPLIFTAGGAFVVSVAATLVKTRQRKKDDDQDEASDDDLEEILYGCSLDELAEQMGKYHRISVFGSRRS